MAAQAPASSIPSTTPQEQPRPTASHGQGQSVPTPQQRSTVAHPNAERPAATTQRPPATDRAESSEKASTAGGSSAGVWVVQLGVFSIQANAERLAQELKSQGFHALVSENSGGGRPLWRVRTGPMAERAAAEQLNARLRAAGHAGSVVPK